MIFFLFPNRSVKQSKLLIGDAIDQFSVVLKKKKMAYYNVVQLLYII